MSKGMKVSDEEYLEYYDLKKERKMRELGKISAYDFHSRISQKARKNVRGYFQTFQMFDPKRGEWIATIPKHWVLVKKDFEKVANLVEKFISNFHKLCNELSADKCNTCPQCKRDRIQEKSKVQVAKTAEQNQKKRARETKEQEKHAKFIASHQLKVVKK